MRREYISICVYKLFTLDLNPGPAEPGFAPPLQTVDSDQLASEDTN